MLFRHIRYAVMVPAGRTLGLDLGGEEFKSVFAAFVIDSESLDLQVRPCSDDYAVGILKMF